MNDSMRELQRTKIDLMQVHNLVDWRTHLATLRRWKDEGRIRYLGVTHYQASAFDELERIISREQIDFVQLPYSVGFRGAERRLFPAAATAGVAVIVNRPFEGGSLFRTALRTPLPASVRAWADSWPQAFLKFVLAQPAVTCVIPGHERTGREVVAESLEVGDEQLEFSFRGNCGYESDFEYQGST